MTTDTLATAMIHARDTGSVVDAPATTLPALDRSAAYDLATRIRAQRVSAGHQIVGWKIGFTNPNVRAQFGADAPIYAAMYDDTVTNDRHLDVSPFVGPRLEPEIVVGLNGDAIAWLALGFEIVQSHCRGWAMTTVDTIVDFGLHARLIVGERRAYRAGDDALLATCSATLSRGDEIVARGRGSDVYGTPVAALMWLQGQLSNDGVPLATDAVITTGSLTTVPPIVAGERWTLTVPELDLPPLSIDAT